MAAVDSTGMETRHVSRYFSDRRGCHYRRYPKVSVVVDVSTHLFLGCVIDRGPLPDTIEFQQVVAQAHRRQPFKSLLGDVGYDAEKFHHYLYRRLGTVGIIPPRRGRAAGKSPAHIRGYFRRILAESWPIAEYGQRWQVETSFSMLKRLLGSALRAHRAKALNREIFLRVLTINLMIIRRLSPSFQQSRCHPQTSVWG
jgi:hypothetical protein